MRYLIPAIVAWIVAQGLKHVFRLIGRNRRIFKVPANTWLMPSGGMPSTHSATVTAFTTYIGLTEGIDSFYFAISLLLASIVVYDSMRVRYSSGRQGELLNELLGEIKSKLLPVRVAHGHTALEALAGTLLGLIVGLVVFFTTN